MDPFSPATPPATKQDHPSSTRPADEDEVVASLLLLKEAAGFEEDKETHLVPAESTVEVNMDVEKKDLGKTVLVTSILVEDYGADEALDKEGDDDVDDELEEEEVEEYDYPAVVTTEEVRPCNRNNGRGWKCPELAEPGYVTCLRHIISGRKAYQRFQSKKMRGSTSGSEATVEPKIEEAATSAVGTQEESAGPSSPGILALAKRSKPGDPSYERDEEAA